jgi:hypothetical protein
MCFTFGGKMTIQRHIPIFFRVPLALLSYGILAFGPTIALLEFRPFNVNPLLILCVGGAWIMLFNRFLMWRVDSFWNVRSLQNHSGKPPYPDNYREFKTIKGWMGWVFLGIDYENKKSEQPAHGDADESK